MKTQRKHGFTIVELVVVIAVIAILAAVLIPTFVSIIKKANNSAYLQERTSQQIADLAEKVENQNYLTWEDFEAVLARELAKVGSDSTVAIENAVKVALAERAGSDNGLSEAQVQKIINEAMSGQLTTAQVQAIVEQSIKNAGFSVGTSGGVTAAQVQSIVSAAIANIPTQTGVTPAMVQNAVKSALENAHVTVSQDDIEKALKAFGVPTATEVEELISAAVAAAKIGEDDISDVKVAKVLNYRLSNTNLTPETAVNPTVVFDALSISNPAVAVATTSGNIILWDSANNRFVVVDGSGKFVYSENATKGDDVSDTYKYWTVSSTVSDTYSTYYTGTESTISTTKGFDAGTTTSVTSVTYTNSESAQGVVIRTNSFATTLTINAPADTVNHYGNAAIVNVEKIAEASYHENGTVGRLTVEEGHAVAEANATIFCFIDAGSDTTATVEVKSGAVVYDKNGESKGQEAIVEGTHDDCGAGHHDFGSQLVIDNKVYEVCKSCGYTLVTVVDLAGNETKVTMVDDEGEIVNTPIETYNSSATNDAGQVIEGKEDPVVETPTVVKSDDVTCTHNFVSTVSIEATCTQTGVKTYTCSICGMSYTSVIPMTAHSYYDHVGAAHTVDETCSVCGHVRGEYVAEVNGTQYKTLTDAIAAVPANTQTLITMINDDAIEGNAGWTIAATQNVVLDLNGYTLKNLVTADAGSQVINNKGTLVIKDSSDLNKDGTGTGIIFNQAKDGANLGTWPTYNYVTNIVTNTGNLTLQSGKLFVAKGSSISYCIDNQSTSYDVAVIINGGQLMNHFTAAIRQFCNSTTKNNVVTINGGIIKGYNAIWMQNPNTYDNKGTLTINGGTFYTEANAYLNGSKTISEVGTSIYNTDGSNHASNMYLTITGGEFFENIEWCGSTSHCTITGGTFHGYVEIESEDVSVTGGTFNNSEIAVEAGWENVGWWYKENIESWIQESFEGLNDCTFEEYQSKSESEWRQYGYKFVLYPSDGSYDIYKWHEAYTFNIFDEYMGSSYSTTPSPVYNNYVVIVQ